MAISVFTHLDECIPPSNQVSLYYNGVNSTNTTQGDLGVYFTNDVTLGLGDVINLPSQCTQGIDIVFVVDYTGSMGGSINGVKAGISNILSTISAESLNNARVGLVLFDETGGLTTNYSSTNTYINLPANQKFQNVNSSAGKVQHITAISKMGAVNDFTDFQQKLALLNTSDFPLGNGLGTPEPGDMGTYEVVKNNLAGAWRAEAIKVVVLITDAVPGGDDDVNNTTDLAYATNTLIPALNSKEVQVMVQSSKSATSTGNYYNNLTTGTTIPGRYDQVSFDANGDWVNTGLITGIQALCDETYYGTCDLASTGWYYRAGDWYTFYFDANSGTITNIYYLPPTYSVTPSTLNTDENGRTITWNIVTQYVANGTTLYWTFNPTGGISASDFINNISSGSFTINNNVGSFQLTTRADSTTEGTESIQIRIRTGSTTGTIVAVSDYTVVQDTSQNVPTATPVPITVYQQYSVQGDGFGNVRSDASCSEFVSVSIWTLRGSTLAYQVGDQVWTNQSRTTLFNGNGYWYQIGDTWSSTPQKVVQIGEGQILNITNCPVVTPTPTPTATATPVPPTPTPTTASSGSGAGFVYLVQCVDGACVLGTTRIASDSSGDPLPNGTFVTLNNMGGCWEIKSTSSSTVQSTVSGLCSGPAQPTATPTPTATTATYKFVVECVSGACLQGTGRVASSSTNWMIGTTVTLDNMSGCWEVMSTSNSTANSAITGSCVVPTPTATAASYVYLMDPCDGTSPYVVAQTNAPKTIGDVYDLTGSFYEATNPYTIISTSTNLPETWIADLTVCPGDTGGGDKCLLEGTLVTLANGTQTAIENLVAGDVLSSVVVGDMPDSDDYNVLKLWSQSNPTLSNTTATVQANTLKVVDSVLSFNNDLLISSKDHIHVVKRSGNWMLLKADAIATGDVFIDKNGNEIEITSITESTGTFNVYKLDVETNDIFIANGIITHNLKPMP